MSLSFQPACLPTGYGGLPHTSAAQAVGRLLAIMPDIVMWPRLPRRSFREQCYVQSALGFPGLIVDAVIGHAFVDRTVAEREIDQLALAYLWGDKVWGALAPEDAPGLVELVRGAAQAPKVHALAGQVLGPVSLGLQLTDEQQRPLAYEPALLEALAQHLALRATWQAERLAEHGHEIIVCLYEPFLSAIGLPFCPVGWEQALDLIESVCAAVPGCCGLLTSGSVDWNTLLSTAVDLVQFDAYAHMGTMLAAAGALALYLDRGGILMWGLIPADEGALGYETAASLAERFQRMVEELAAAGVERTALLEASLICPNATLANLPIATAENALQLCAEVSALVRSSYQLGTETRRPGDQETP